MWQIVLLCLLLAGCGPMEGLLMLAMFALPIGILAGIVYGAVRFIAWAARRK